MCDGTAPVPIPQSLVCTLFQALFETPLKKVREASVDYKGKFCTSKNLANSCGKYELMGVVMGFGKGETSLATLISTIDIALGDTEGRLSRNKLAIIAAFWKAATTRKGRIAGATITVMMEEATEVGATAMTIIPTEEPFPCRSVLVN